MNTASCTPALTHSRHREHLKDCLVELKSSLEALRGSDEDVVLVGHHLQQALSHIAKITGRITNEDILDRIFKEFCIGK